jgi:serine/threonine protein kinase
LAAFALNQAPAVEMFWLALLPRAGIERLLLHGAGLRSARPKGRFASSGHAPVFAVAPRRRLSQGQAMAEDTRGADRVVAEEPWPGFALPRGTKVNGYRIERILGSGGFGITYLAADLLGQHFAIKEYYPRQFAIRRDMTVQPNTAEDQPLFDECKERFLREAHALVRLGRIAGAADGIVRVQTYFEAFGTGFLVMDYVAGESVAAMLRREPGGLPPERVRSLLLQLLASARTVHQAGLVHRDIKPANIIMRTNERLVLIDFGATRHATPGETTSYTQIYSGGYAPPEQMLGLRQAEFSDIYAIGAVCYRAIGGAVVNSLARQNSLAAGYQDPLVPAATVGAGRYPRSLLAAIDAALAVDPGRRPPTADAMLALLGPGEAPSAATAAADTPAIAQPRSGRLAWLAAAASVVVLAGSAYLLVPGPAAPPPAVEVPAAPEPPTVARTEAEPAVEPTPPRPAAPPEPQREAVAAPPPVPQPPALSPLEQMRTLAASLPCAALSVAGDGDAVRVSGFVAGVGPEFDRLLTKAQDAGRLVDAVSRIDRFACAPLEVLAPVIRRNWDGGPSGPALRLERGSVAVGGRLGISVADTQPALYVDLYQPDGQVRHLLRAAPSGATARKATEWIAASPAGQHLVVAISAARALGLGPRAETERTGDYLDALRAQLADASFAARADLAMVMVRATEPVAAKPSPRQNNGRSEKCANIVNRAQLGETLSNAEIAALQNECRS